MAQSFTLRDITVPIASSNREINELLQKLKALSESTASEIKVMQSSSMPKANLEVDGVDLEERN